MELKNLDTLIDMLVEKIRELQVDLSLARYERDALKRENEMLKKNERIEKNND